MKNAIIAFARTIGVVGLTAILSYIGSADHLAFLNPITATIISGLALTLEHSIESRTGKALFGAVRA